MITNIKDKFLLAKDARLPIFFVNPTEFCMDDEEEIGIYNDEVKKMSILIENMRLYQTNKLEAHKMKEDKMEE